MAEAEIREHLSAFGLSDTEISAYLAILRRGVATTGDVAAAADVSQGYVYDVAETLAERGLVTIDESASPTQLRARAPEEAVGSLSARLTDLQTAVEDVHDPAAESAAGFEVVRSRETVERRAERLLDEARAEVILVVPAPTLERLRESLVEAVERGVFVYCLLAALGPETVVSSLDEPARYAHVIRTWEARSPVFALRDGSAGVFGSHGILSGRHTDDYAVAFSQPEIANGFYGNAISNVWPMATERFVAEPASLPATFDFFRSGVVTAAQHVAAGRELVADLVVTETATGERAELRAVPVREVKQSFVEPVTSDFPIENGLVVGTEEGRVSVGGDYAGFDPYYEDYAAHEITLREA